MKIHGQDFKVVFSNLPWPYKVVTLAGAAFLALVLVYVPYTLFLRGMADGSPTAEAIKIPESSQRGAFGMLDPSLATNGTNVWMAYAVQEHPSSAPEKTLMHIRLATAAAGKCQRWAQQFNAGIEGKSDEILGPDGQTIFRTGVWRAETPSLVYDPDDKGREWKLFAYKYFWADNPEARLPVAQHFGMIIYRHAPDPAGEWSTEQWLFSPAPGYPPPPYEQMVALHLSHLDPSLEKIVTYSRPSVIYKEGRLIMTLSAFTGDDTPDRIVMLASSDHGASWKYVGTPLQKADLAALGPYTRLGGASLIDAGGQIYLAAVPGDDRQRGSGTLILAFEDLARGTLRRDAKTGALRPIKRVPLQDSTGGSPVGGGFAAYSDACSTGLLTSEQKAGAPGFQIFKTFTNPVD